MRRRKEICHKQTFREGKPSSSPQTVVVGDIWHLRLSSDLQKMRNQSSTHLPLCIGRVEHALQLGLSHQLVLFGHGSSPASAMSTHINTHTLARARAHTHTHTHTHTHKYKSTDTNTLAYICICIGIGICITYTNERTNEKTHVSFFLECMSFCL